MTTPRKIIIDTDPGQDDAVAILLALASPESSRSSASPPSPATCPCRSPNETPASSCELAGRPESRSSPAATRPLPRKLVTAEHVHGKTGLDGPHLPEPVMPLQAQHGVDFIIDTLRAEPAGTVTLCPLGPLTNIATAFQRAPDIVARVPEIVLMGGAYFEVGNITPAAEFNIYVDPEAADIVFRSGVPLVVMPLDVTHKALTTAPRVEALRAIGTAVGQMPSPPGPISSNASTWRNTAATAPRCTTPASSPTCSSPTSSRAATSTSRSRRRANSPSA